VVCDLHQVARSHPFPHTAGSIGQDHGLDSERSHDPDRKGHFTHGMAFVIMEAALHDGDSLAAPLAEMQFAGVSRHSGLRETRNRFIV